eukprot:TRINITY_DN7249_c0_g1_i3.p1 TRINITY_DN7249_c0_g1~~TRINITY_DN7249_c0_g1_i3.p1  ORF type:complete len:183 (-),score=13.56 TRINITY_DN7249_c0_g1_i3:455-1003(-)
MTDDNEILTYGQLWRRQQKKVESHGITDTQPQVKKDPLLAALTDPSRNFFSTVYWIIVYMFFTLEAVSGITLIIMGFKWGHWVAIIVSVLLLFSSSLSCYGVRRTRIVNPTTLQKFLYYTGWTSNLLLFIWTLVMIFIHFTAPDPRVSVFPYKCKREYNCIRLTEDKPVDAEGTLLRIQSAD